MALQAGCGTKLPIGIFQGAGLGGPLLHTQDVTTPYDSGSVTPMIDVPLTSGVPVVAGQVYTIGVSNVADPTTSESCGDTGYSGGSYGGFCGTLADVYAGGSAWFNLNAFPGAEATFRVVIAPSP